jgi:uncharacterized membrane protein
VNPLTPSVVSTFVMISQNRGDAKREVLADQQWSTVKQEDDQNKELLGLSQQILELTKQLHESASSASRLANAKEEG